FFQAEDGIRDFHVTGVQTCALPIYGVPQARESCTAGRVLRGGRFPFVGVLVDGYPPKSACSNAKMGADGWGDRVASTPEHRMRPSSRPFTAVLVFASQMSTRRTLSPPRTLELHSRA